MRTLGIRPQTLFGILISGFALCPQIILAADFVRVEAGPETIEVIDDVVSADLNPTGCSEGFEAACSTFLQLQRSEVVFEDAQQHGNATTYRWEILVPEDFTYKSPGGHLRAARFILDSGDSILSFLLDSDDGYHVNRQRCFGPEAFGEWHSVEAQIVWDSTRKKGLKDRTPGMIQVWCNDREVFATSGRPTIPEGDTVRLALGLMGAMQLVEGDNASVKFRAISIEETSAQK